MTAPSFDGATFSATRDGSRLAQQMGRVRRFMADGVWHTLAEIAAECDAPEASVSARLRDLRKPRFGAWTVERRYVSAGLYEYRLSQPAAPVPSGAAGTTHDRDASGSVSPVQPSAPAASRPGAEGALTSRTAPEGALAASPEGSSGDPLPGGPLGASWACATCGSRTSAVGEVLLGDMARGYCTGCQTARVFRRRVA